MRKKKNSVRELLHYGKYLNAIDKKRLPLAVLTNAALALSEVVFSVLIVRYIINAYSNGQFSMLHFTIVMCLALVFQISVWAIESYYYEYYSRISDTTIIGTIYKELFVLLKKFPLKQIEHSDYYQKYYFVINDVENRVGEYWGLVESITGTFVTLSSLSAIIAVTEPLLIFLFLFPVIIDVLIAPSLNVKKYEYDVSRKEADRKGEYIQRVMYMKDYAKDMRLTSISKVVLLQYEEYLKNLITIIQKRTPQIIHRGVFITMSYQVISFFSVILWVCFRVRAGAMDIGSGVVIISLYNQIVYSMKNVVNLYSEVKRQSNYINDFFAFKQDAKKSENNRKKNTVTLDKIEQVCFEHVSFSYDEGKEALEDVSFEAKKGQKIAILGENGSGKSTLVKLLLNLYQAESGTIRINDQEIEKYDTDDYLGLIGVIMQDYRLFSASVYKNISEKCNDGEKDYKYYQKAMQLGGFYETFEKLGLDMETVLTKEFDDKGIVLSGGQSQKLAISRAIAKQSDMLILDEPTSSLDPLAEARFFDIIRNYFHDKIVFCVSHNYSLGKIVDYILFIQNGRIVEKGTHHELMKLNGKYAGMYKMQAENFQGKVKEDENAE